MVERAVTQPPAGKVRIRVEACGVCHTDAFDRQKAYFQADAKREQK
jgi:Zn-dependent alcohol dehydrogenase